jgi:hypothetical protein
MDDRIKKNTNAGRENRASQDDSRAAPEEKFVSSEERRRMFRSEWLQEALPTPPEIPGYHLCWLSSTNQYDPIHKRMRLGYEPVKAEELPGFEHLKVKAGEHVGFVACNEMLLYKLPMDIYQELMYELHQLAPMEEQQKIKVQQEQLLGERDSNGKTLVTIEGGGVGFDAKVKPRPVFE